MTKKKDLLADKTSLIVHYKTTFGSTHGQDVLHDLMKKNHVFTGTFDKDAMTMAFREGQRAVIFDIMQMINMDIEKFKKMFEETNMESDL